MSTRRVEDLVQAMGFEGISKSEVNRIAGELLADGRHLGPLDLRAARRGGDLGGLAEPVREVVDGSPDASAGGTHPAREAQPVRMELPLSYNWNLWMHHRLEGAAYLPH